MACVYCGSRLITKTSQGLVCCGCGRSVAATGPSGAAGLSWRKRMLALLLVLMALPLVGAVAATDQLRSGSLAVDREPAQSQDSAEP